MTEPSLEQVLTELNSAEEFLDYFAIAYDPAVVRVNRLHILQRFHDYLHEAATAMPVSDEPRRVAYARLLQRAYQDFVGSSACEQRVFKVFQRQAAQEIRVPLAALSRRARS